METFSPLLALRAGNSPVTGDFLAQKPGTLSFDVSMICAWLKGWVNKREAGDLRRHHAHYDVTVMHFVQILFLCTLDRYWFTITQITHISGYKANAIYIYWVDNISIAISLSTITDDQWADAGCFKGSEHFFLSNSHDVCHCSFHKQFWIHRFLPFLQRGKHICIVKWKSIAHTVGFRQVDMYSVLYNEVC